jgi:hypothetical protein
LNSSLPDYVLLAETLRNLSDKVVEHSDGARNWLKVLGALLDSRRKYHESMVNLDSTEAGQQEGEMEDDAELRQRIPAVTNALIQWAYKCIRLCKHVFLECMHLLRLAQRRMKEVI